MRTTCTKLDHDAITHQTASINTHSFRLFAAGCSIQYVAKVVVEVVSQSQAAELTGAGAWQEKTPVSVLVVVYGKRERLEV